MQFILPILYAFLFIFLISRMNFFVIESLSKAKLVILFILKLIAGIVVIYVYTKHYPCSDFQLFFSDGKILWNAILKNASTIPMSGWNANFETVLFNNSRVMILLNAIIQPFSFGNYYVHGVFFCFFSFVGLVAIYRAFISHFPTKKIQLIIAVFLVPSVLFFSSAVSKESVVIALAGLLVYFSDFGLKPKYTLNKIIIIVLLLVMLMFVKIYVATILLPLLIANAVIARTSKKSMSLKYALVFVSFALLGVVAKTINRDYNVLQIIADKQAKAISEARGGVFLVSDKNFICVDYNRKDDILSRQTNGVYKMRNGSSYLSWKLDNMADTTFIINSRDTANYTVYYMIPPAKTTLNIKRLKPDLREFLLCAPKAMVNVLFQPSLFNIKSWLHLLSAIENLYLALIMLLAIIFFDSTILLKKEVFAFCLIFTIILFVLIGITTPVVGAMVRYRTVGLLFFVTICLMMMDEQKMKKKLFKKK